MTIAENVKRLREAAGLSQSRLAALSGVSQQLISQIEAGTNRTTKNLPDLARGLKVSISEIDPTFVASINSEGLIVPITGRVGAATDGEIIQSNSDGGFGHVRAPYGSSSSTIAVEVDGQSMGALAAGSIVFYSVLHPTPLPDMIGHPVVVQLDDGRILLKELLRGSDPTVWDLRSINGPLLPDQRIEWVAHIDAIIPPWRARMLRIEAFDVAL